MEFTIFSRYTSPARQLNWFWVEIDENVFSREDRMRNLIKSPHEWFTAETAGPVEAITLFKGMGVFEHDKTLYNRFSDMSIFTNLKFLSIPLDAIAYIDTASIAKQLEHLHITAPRAVEFLDYFEKDKRPVLFEESFPQLKTLALLCSPTLFRNFNVARFPALEWLTASLGFDKSGKGIKLFEKAKSLHGFSLNVISKKDLLKGIRKDLVGLELWGVSARDFDFSYLTEFKSLKYLSLRNSKAPIDCSIFSNLQNLLEIELFSINKLKNIDALLSIESLEKVHIYPDDKSDLTEEFKKQMRIKFKNCSILSFEITK